MATKCNEKTKIKILKWAEIESCIKNGEIPITIIQSVKTRTLSPDELGVYITLLLHSHEEKSQIIGPFKHWELMFFEFDLMSVRNPGVFFFNCVCELANVGLVEILEDSNEQIAGEYNNKSQKMGNISKRDIGQ